VPRVLDGGLPEGVYEFRFDVDMNVNDQHGYIVA
jgi:hypothetical protein